MCANCERAKLACTFAATPEPPTARRQRVPSSTAATPLSPGPDLSPIGLSALQKLIVDQQQATLNAYHPVAGPGPSTLGHRATVDDSRFETLDDDDQEPPTTNAIVPAMISGSRFNVNELRAFFPDLEQRQMFYHFLRETADVIVAVPTPRHRNPWRHNFVKLAVGTPSGLDVVHDAFRFGLLSLASFDIGYRMSPALLAPGDNAMYDCSRVQRRRAIDALRAAKTMGKFRGDLAAADLAVATVVSLAVRDRLAGTAEWETPLKLAIDIVLGFGGPEIFIALDPTPARRFLIEQLACVEIVGCLMSIESPRLLSPDSLWLTEAPPALEYDDHVELVYGLDRDVVQFLARSMQLVDLKRETEALSATLESFPHPDVERGLQEKTAAMIARAHAFLSDDGLPLVPRTLIKPRRILAGNLLSRSVTILWIRVEILLQSGRSDDVRDVIDTILDLVEHEIEQHVSHGLLMPLSLAAGYAFGDQRVRAKALLERLKPRSFLDHALTTRLVAFFWRVSDHNEALPYHGWQQKLREAECYAPIW